MQGSKVAVSDGASTYTFAELDALSSRFAGLLLAHGVCRGDRVAFCAPKSAPLVVSIVGCLKAGAIYVPVDSKSPKDRQLLILNEVRPRAIVSSRAVHDAIVPDLACPAFHIEDRQLPDLLREGPQDTDLPVVESDDAAYCLYTSGSTGRPKGVLIEHGSVTAFFSALGEFMNLDASCRCMNTSELHFDVHVMDLFFPLHRGATVHLACAPLLANRLLEILARERITHFTAVGPLMTLMTEGSLFEHIDLSSVVRVMTGAEIVNVNTMQRWLQKIPGVSLVNGYGPTEATVICTAYLIDRLEPGRIDFYPIGRPLRGCDILLFDDGHQITTPLVKGELLIGGPQVMRGYWNDPEQTRAKMLNIAGSRYYRSGDVCQWLPDGNLDYVGRTDEQVKISGFRIDLSEIKRVMDTAPAVREGHPVVAAHPALGTVIAACFTCEEPDAVDNETVFSALQSALKEQLPYYMIPSLYFVFDQFPKLSSGKTDKKQILERVNRLLQDSHNGMSQFACRKGQE